jgi:hypothetical protein
LLFISYSKMNAASGQAGQGGQAAPGGDPTRAGTTSAQVNEITATSGFATSTTSHPISSTFVTASASAAASPNATKVGLPVSSSNIIIGLVLGGVILLATWFVVGFLKEWFPCWTNKRRDRMAEKAEKPQKGIQWLIPRYNPLYPTPEGTRWNSIAPSTPAAVLPTHTTYAPGVPPVRPFMTSGVLDTVPERGGDIGQHPSVEERNSGNSLPPTYAQSQSSMSISGRRSSRPLHTSTSAPSEPFVSSLSPEERGIDALLSSQTDGAAFMSPQTTEYSGPIFLPHTRVKTRVGLRSLFPDYTSDTSGDSAHTVRQNQVNPIVAPTPVHLLNHAGSLERAVRDGMRSTSPNPLISEDWSTFSRKSGALGEQNPVRMVRTRPLPTHISQAGVARNVSSVSSVMSIISDEALERLGVGSRGVYQPRG